MPDIELNYKGWCDRCRTPLRKKMVEAIFRKFEARLSSDESSEVSEGMGSITSTPLKFCYDCTTKIISDATKNLGQDDPIERTRSC